jgi:tetratricopeptide (TPR) repeat protein
VRAPARLTVAFLLCVLSWLSAAKLVAQPPSDPQSESGRAAIERGHEAVSLFERGDWQGALARFQEAEALYHSPVFVLFSARCLRHMGELDQARFAYLRLVDEPLDAGVPEPWKQAQADGRAELTSLEQALAAAPSPPEQTARPPAPVEPAPQRDESRRRMYLSGLVLTAVGGASLIAGTVVGALALHEEAGALPDACNGTSCPESQKDAIERNYARVHALAASADTLLITGAVVAAAGMVLVIVGRPGRADLSLAPAPGGASLTGRF